MTFPFQQIYIDDNKVIRFRENSIVRYLLDNGSIDLNDLARVEFSDDDRAHFAQLIGYSVSSWGGLSYVSPELCQRGDALAEIVASILTDDQ